MRSDTVVGYTYAADIYCPDHIVAVMGEAAYGYRAEQRLHQLAWSRNIDRYDERTFDSDDFPKVIFADMVHDGCTADNGYEPGQCGDQCGRCGAHLGFDCPNVVVS